MKDTLLWLGGGGGGGGGGGWRALQNEYAVLPM